MNWPTIRTFLRRNMPIIATVGVILTAITVIPVFRSQQPPTQTEPNKKPPEKGAEQEKKSHQQSPPTIEYSKAAVVPKEEKAQSPSPQPIVNANNSNVVVGPASNVTQNIYREPIPRSLTQDKIPALKAELSKHNNEPIDITCVMGDQEAFSFASQLKNLFESSGWKVNGVNQAIYTVPIKGIIIVIKDKSEEQKANFIFQLLKFAGFHSHGELNDKSTSIGIVIGAKE